MILAAGAGSSAGPLGLLIVVLMAIATVLLIKNMNSRLKRLPQSFEPVSPALNPEEEPDAPSSDPSADA